MAEVVEQLKSDTHDMSLSTWWKQLNIENELRMAYKVSNVVVNSTPVVFVSDSEYGSVDSGMSDIVIESNYSVYLTGKWYLQVFDTAVFLAETLDVLRDINKIKLKYIRTNLHYFVVQEVNPLALPDKILLLVAIALDFWWNYIR